MSEKYIKILLLFGTLIISASMFSQTQDTLKSEGEELLEKAMSPFQKGSGEIHFKRIAYNLKDPMNIFTLKKEEVFTSCYYIFDGNKFEINLGEIQAISDGKVIITASLLNGDMYIDSMRTANPIDNQAPTVSDFTNLFKDDFGDSKIEYLGSEKIDNVLCKKVKCGFSKTNDFVLFWIDTTTSKLLLMADYQDKTYNTYLIQSISNIDSNHDFTISLPNKELETFAGFKVMDMRFADSKLHKVIQDK
jgi:hypothetical protein